MRHSLVGSDLSAECKLQNLTRFGVSFDIAVIGFFPPADSSAVN
jgi:hypothetical protein